MFGVTIPPGINIVRIYALSGRQGKPPCIWEGPPMVDQTAIESGIGSDARVLRWLKRNNLMHNSVATLNLQIDCFSQGKRVESINAHDISILLGKPKQKRNAGEEIGLRAFDLCEHMLDSYKEILDERDTVIGRLVERGLKCGELAKSTTPPPPVEPPKDTLDDLLDKGTKLLAIAQSFRSMRDPN